MIFDNRGIRQQLTHARDAVIQDHPPSRDDHPGRATIGRRSPDAGSGVGPGQISVFLASRTSLPQLQPPHHHNFQLTHHASSSARAQKSNLPPPPPLSRLLPIQPKPNLPPSTPHASQLSLTEFIPPHSTSTSVSSCN